MEQTIRFKHSPKNETIPAVMFVDHEKNGRSGHLSHALAEYKKDHIIAFYSNCSGKRNKWSPGHNGFGWLEYKRSADGGITWSDAKIFPYSWDAFINEPFTVSCEKAVSVKENEIAALCIRNLNPNGWEPYMEPVCVRSEDGGETWSDAVPICDKKGRIYDALVWNGSIYLLMLANDDFLATKPEHRYYIYRSDDGGRHFVLQGELPGDSNGHAYGSMAMRDDGALICYEYDSNDEYHLVYHISFDMGKTFAESGKSYCAKRIRNPQTALFEGIYILHGRSEGAMGFAFYTSENGYEWDEGILLAHNPKPIGCFYSNNIALTDELGKFLMVQYSESYDCSDRVNVRHVKLRVKRK